LAAKPEKDAPSISQKQRERALKANAEHYISFTAVSEPWARYLLSDGTVIRVRFVLLKMLRGADSEGGVHQAKMTSQTLIAVEPAPEYVGAPGRAITPQEAEAVVDAELGFVPLEERAAPSIYLFEGSRQVIAVTTIRRVRRTTANGTDGERVYLTETMVQVTTVGPPAVDQTSNVR
jgi:hypothetical protein